jgi:hemerythrin-like metal-binding protein
MIRWDPTLELGHDVIDGQHRTLFTRAAAVSEAIRAGRAADEVRATLRFLTDYVGEHFAAEEALMREAGFPGATAHAELHRRIERRLVEIATAWSAHGATPALLADVEAMMSGWVTIHIAERDRELALFLARGGPGVF